MPTSVPFPGRIVLLAAVVLPLAAGTIPWMSPQADHAAAREFQASTGGLGGGAVVQASWCFHALDPRLEEVCPTSLRPLPGGPAFCPHETTSLFRHER